MNFHGFGEFFHNLKVVQGNDSLAFGRTSLWWILVKPELGERLSKKVASSGLRCPVWKQTLESDLLGREQRISWGHFSLIQITGGKKWEEAFSGKKCGRMATIFFSHISLFLKKKKIHPSLALAALFPTWAQTLWPQLIGTQWGQGSIH